MEESNVSVNFLHEHYFQLVFHSFILESRFCAVVVGRVVNASNMNKSNSTKQRTSEWMSKWMEQNQKNENEQVDRLSYGKTRTNNNQFR